MTKFFIIVALFALSASFVKGTTKEEWTKQIEVQREECKKEVGATQADLDEVALKKALTTKTAQCLAACLMKKHKVMDNNGKFVKPAALEYMKLTSNGNQAQYKVGAEVIEACAAIPLPADHCEAAKALFACFNKHTAEKS